MGTLPNTEITEIEYGKAYPLKMGMRNCFQLASNTIIFPYELDVDVPSAKNDEIILESTDKSWIQTVKVKSLTEYEPNWVKLEFKNVPKSGSYNLIQDPKDNEAPFFIFRDVSYEDMINSDGESSDKSKT